MNAGRRRNDTVKFCVLYLGWLGIFVFATQPALAARASDIPTGYTCRAQADGSIIFDKSRFLSWLLEAENIPSWFLDENDDGNILYEERLDRFAALIDNPNMCRTATAPGTNTKLGCDPGSLSVWGNIVEEFGETGTSVPIGQPWQLDGATAQTSIYAKWQSAGAVDAKNFVRVLGENPTHVTLYCDKLPQTQSTQQGPKASPSVDGQGGSSLLDSVLGSLRFRGNKNDLTIPPNDPRFKKASSGSFSINSDQKSDEAKYQVQAFLGYDLGYIDLGDRVSLKTIPFIGWERRFTRGGTDTSETDALSIGLVNEWYVTGSGWAFNLQTNGVYTTDSHADTEIGHLQAQLSPAFDIGNGKLFPFAPVYFDGVVMFTELDLRVQGGEVFNSGGNDVLEESRSFLFAGPHFGVTFAGMKQTPLEHFAASFRYQYLEGLSGQYDDLERLETSISYTFPGSSNFSALLKYTNGRQDNDLKDVEIIEFGIGAKF